jgi:putative protein-disulfide isomerase
MKPQLIYCFDAYCGWCYGFSPVIKKLYLKYKSTIAFEALSGNMISKAQQHPIAQTAAYILNAIPTVEASTGVKFGEDFKWHLQNPTLSDWIIDSEKPAIATTIIKDLAFEKSIDFIAAMQYGLFYEGRDLCDDEAYRHLLQEFDINEEDFYLKLHSEAYLKKTYEEFNLVQQLKVTGFPQILMQVAADKFYLLSQGYVAYEVLEERIEKLLHT